MKIERYRDRSALEVRTARESSLCLDYKIGELESEMLFTDP